MNKLKIEENWLIESLPVWDWSNGYKYSKLDGHCNKR